MPQIENSKKIPIFIGISLLIILIIVAIVLAFRGNANGIRLLWIIGKWIAIAFVLGLIIFAVVWLFSPQRSDAIFLNRERYIKACKLNKPETPQDLYFKGSDEWEYKKIGQIVGVCRVKIIKTKLDKPIREKIKGRWQQKYIITVDSKGQQIKTPMYEKEELIEDIIAFKKSLISEIKLVRVLKTERSSLNADKVFLKAMAFTPELYGFYYLPNRFRDKETIDRVIADEIHRSSLQHVLGEEQNIVDEAIAISPRHQKELDKTKYQVISTSVNPNNPPQQSV